MMSGVTRGKACSVPFMNRGSRSMMKLIRDVRSDSFGEAGVTSPLLDYATASQTRSYRASGVYERAFTSPQALVCCFLYLYALARYSEARRGGEMNLRDGSGMGIARHLYFR